LNFKKITFFCLIFSILTININAQIGDFDSHGFNYARGDQMFTVRAGILWPLFFATPFSAPPDRSAGIHSTNLSIGGVGALEWSSYINSRVTLGGELSGMFAFSPNGRVLYMIPLTFKAAYWFRRYPFEFPIHCGVGVSLNSIGGDSFSLDFIVKPGASAIWNFNHEWAFGFHAVYWWIPQIYTGRGRVPREHTMFGNFLETTFSAMFRF